MVPREFLSRKGKKKISRKYHNIIELRAWTLEPDWLSGFESRLCHFLWLGMICFSLCVNVLSGKIGKAVPRVAWIQ